MAWHLIARGATYIAKKKLRNKLSDNQHGSTLRHVLVAAGFVSVPAAMVLLVMVLGLAAVVAGGPAAAGGGALGIPPVVFSAYLAAETNAPNVAADCRVDWPVVAGIWKVESDHATYRGRTINGHFP